MQTTKNIFQEQKSISADLIFAAIDKDKLTRLEDSPAVREELALVEFILDELSADLLGTGFYYEC